MAITYDCKTCKPCEGCEWKDVKFYEEHTYCAICDPCGSRGDHCAYCGNSFVCQDIIVETENGPMHPDCAAKDGAGNQ